LRAGFCSWGKGSVKWEVRKRMTAFQRARKKVRNLLNKRGKEKIKVTFWMFVMRGGLGVEAVIRKLYFKIIF